MPCLSKAVYYKQVEKILETQEDKAPQKHRNAGQRLQKLILAENDILDSSAILDAAVSFAGTWAKRKFTSMTRVVFAFQ